MRKRKITLVLMTLIIGLSTVIIGCSNINSNQLPEEMDKIKLEVVSKSELPEGINYAIKLKNGSSFTIKQNTVYISYPVNNGSSGYMANQAKVQAEGNKLDIRPGEEIALSVFIPNVFDSEKVDQNRLQYEIEGYINEVKDSNHFGQSGGDLFN
ncbi:hypothetical protein Desdi_0707 [Desulfitobacterium dichloroeliminans LMG P-21439]|uniref:Uncharacterized protein n=1 Tax=Desulfitobacterium dichloroeliminans (strain LMG P-21439 / DCA1) TaxID=871963 RepID=L0F307_DESDL|nr:hypothetical protein [Desulfitobacterium dichloroeliminans]AGA68234.1 hypothetical protein Desdi_0707 [Desulfitobacterium dichloroeliminans LMG P-21439]